jgi:hypothetical protein
VEISIPEEVSLRLKPRQIDTSTDGDDDDGSITSELSLDFLAKEREEEKATVSQSSSSNGWNPECSDYSLDVLLRSKDEEEDGESVADSAKESLMTSDYSLNIRLSRSQHSLKTQSQHSLKGTSSSSSIGLGASQDSFDTIATFGTTTNKSVDAGLTEEANTGKKTEAPTRKVNFFARVRILRITNRKDLHKSQIQRVWYSRDEFKAIRGECFDTIKLMQDDEIVDEDEGFCTLGLEYKTKKNYKTRQRNKMEMRQVVFEEQEFQRENELPDAEWIARVSREQSATCVEGARDTGRKVEEEIREYSRLNDRNQ